MIVPEFEYLSPQSVQEACALLIQYGANAKVLAGGSDLLVKMKDGLMKPAYLVSLKNLDSLKAIRYQKGAGVIIGARATHNEVMNNDILQAKYRSVCEAAHSMAADQIRNVGTIGGNLVNAVPSADLPPILIALDSQARIVGTSGSEPFHWRISFSDQARLRLRAERSSRKSSFQISQRPAATTSSSGCVGQERWPWPALPVALRSAMVPAKTFASSSAQWRRHRCERVRPSKSCAVRRLARNSSMKPGESPRSNQNLSMISGAASSIGATSSTY